MPQQPPATLIGSFAPDLPPAYYAGRHIRKAPKTTATFARILASCFAWPDTVRPWVARLISRPGWHPYLVFDGDTPVAAAACYLTGDHGYMGPAATWPAYRGRGAQNALIVRRIRDAAKLECKLLVTETAEDRHEQPAPSYPNMRRPVFAPPTSAPTTSTPPASAGKPSPVPDISPAAAMTQPSSLPVELRRSPPESATATQGRAAARPPCHPNQSSVITPGLHLILSNSFVGACRWHAHLNKPEPITR